MIIKAIYKLIRIDLKNIIISMNFNKSFAKLRREMTVLFYFNIVLCFDF